MEPNGELLCHELNVNGRGAGANGHWYEWVGGRILRTSFGKILYDLPDVDINPPVQVGDIIRIGPYRLKMLELEPSTATVLFIKQRGIYVSPRWSTTKLMEKLRDWLGFHVIRWGGKMLEWGNR